MIELFLIRHCEGNANKKNLVSGDDQDGLSDNGLCQLQNLKHYLESKQFSVDIVYTSTWKRALLTANELFGDDVIIANELGETNSGLDSYLNNSEFIIQNPDFYLSRLNKYNGGESHFEMQMRVISFFNKIIKMRNDEKIAIVSHAGPLTTIIQYLLNLDFNKYFPKFIPSHGSISKLLINNNGEMESLIFFSYTPDDLSMSKMIKSTKIWP